MAVSHPSADLHASSIVVGAGVHDEVGYGLASPIFLSSATLYPNPSATIAYPRYFNNPNQDAVALKVAALEGAQDGIVFSSGMAAISTVLLSFMESGSHAIFCSSLYGGTRAFLSSEFPKLGFDFSLVDSGDVSDYEKALKPNTKVVYIETPSNPLLKLIDVAAIAAFAKKHNLISVIDNTFASPINQQPHKMGIDIVVHSATKYLNGHSDLCAGIAVGTKANIKKIKATGQNYGGSMSGLDCYLLERGLKTLAIRVRQQNANALHLAQFLLQHPKIKAVHYPGLPSHPSNELAKKQMKGFGGMLAFELKCDGVGLQAFLQTLHMIKVAVSLGGVESTLTLPALTSHAKLSPDERKALGISDNLCRLSVGIEEIEDLVCDLTRALDILPL